MTKQTVSSPRWSSTTKLLVGLIILGVGTFLIYRFSSLIAPLLMIFIITYLLHPVNAMIARVLRISWKAAVNILFLLIVIILVGLLTWGGFGIAGQIESLINSIEGIISNLPVYIARISTQTFTIGPYVLDMRNYDLTNINQQLLSYINPLLGRTGNLVGALAGGAAQFFGWTFFILLASYFVMTESSGLREDMLKINIPGYTDDIKRLGDELNLIWNAFLRGQIIIFLLTLTIYSIFLPAMQVNYALGIALMTGLARFLPYIGPAITWGVMALVTYFQPVKPFGLQDHALTYMIIIVISTSFIDWIIDNFISPRIMARSLKVHPAAVLVAAIIAANLLGVLGVVIAAPFLASFLLLGRYIMRKMFDLNPWPKTEPDPPPPSFRNMMNNFKQFWQSRFAKKNMNPTTQKENQENEQQPK